MEQPVGLAWAVAQAQVQAARRRSCHRRPKPRPRPLRQHTHGAVLPVAVLPFTGNDIEFFMLLAASWLLPL